MAETTKISAVSRVSVKIRDSFYTVEYGEERTIGPDDNVTEERKALWTDVHGEVDKQVEEIVSTFS